MSADVSGLLRRSQFVFECTVEATAKSMLPDLPVDERTIVAKIEKVLHGPAALAQAAGSEVTVQLAEGLPVLAVGDRAVLFTTAIAFGQHMAVAEVGRTAPDAVGSSIMAAGAPATLPGARPGRSHPVLEAAAQLETDRLRAHAAEAEDVVVGRILSLEKVGPPSISEHDPDWWRATINVEHSEKGKATGQIQVLYPGSSDVHWAHLPKLRPGQEGLWILHATGVDLAQMAPYSLLDADDAHPADQLDRLRGDGN